MGKVANSLWRISAQIGLLRSQKLRSQFSPLAFRAFGTTINHEAKFSTPIPEFENEPGIKSHKDLYDFSLANPEEFWGRLAKSRLKWFDDFDTVKDCDMKTGQISWFLNGKINVSGRYFLILSVLILLT
jgi:hypothetical protein